MRDSIMESVIHRLLNKLEDSEQKAMKLFAQTRELKLEREKLLQEVEAVKIAHINSPLHQSIINWALHTKLQEYSNEVPTRRFILEQRLLLMRMPRRSGKTTIAQSIKALGGSSWVLLRMKDPLPIAESLRGRRLTGIVIDEGYRVSLAELLDFICENAYVLDPQFRIVYLTT